MAHGKFVILNFIVRLLARQWVASCSFDSCGFGYNLLDVQGSLLQND